MEPHHHQKNRENDVEKPIELAAAAAQSSASTSPPSQSSSASSSPSQEFSFTVSHHSFSTPFPGNKSKSPNSLALDLSPADEIFFHGHLLPLQILSHFPATSSPRSSTNSNDSFTLPIRDLLQLQSYQSPTRDSVSSSNNSNSSSNITSESNNSSKSERINNNIGTKRVEGKSKFAFLSFGFAKEHKGCHVKDKEDKEKNKKNFGVIHALKKYLRMVKPHRIFRGEREKVRLQGKSYSYSGNVTPRKNKQELRSWRGQFSAPASMRTSPSNSGLLLATSTTLPPSPPSESTMEELQAAIQAAIAHCKNSFAKEDKLKC